MTQKPASRVQWRTVIESYQNSNLSQKQFCIEQGLVHHCFVYYLRQYRKQTQTLSLNKSPSFSNVIINPPHKSVMHEVKIELPNGFRCQMPCTVPSEQLKNIIGALLSC